MKTRCVHKVILGMQAGSYARGGVGQTAGMAAQLQQQQLQVVLNECVLILFHI